MQEENGNSLAWIIKSVSFECASRLSGGGGMNIKQSMERSLERKPAIDLHAEPFEITRWSRAPYDIMVEVTLNDGTKFKVSHHLCLYNSGSWSDRKASTEDDTFPVTKYVICKRRPGNVQC